MNSTASLGPESNPDTTGPTCAYPSPEVLMHTVVQTVSGQSEAGGGDVQQSERRRRQRLDLCGRPDTQATDDGTWKNGNGRLTWQASAAQQVQLLLGRAAVVHVVHQRRQRDDGAGSARQQPCAPRVQQATWSSPVTSRLLLEAGLGGEPDRRLRDPGNLPNYNALIPVTELCYGRLCGQRRHRRACISSEQLLRGRQRCLQLARVGELRHGPDATRSSAIRGSKS